jgi:hypothetical protein
MSLAGCASFWAALPTVVAAFEDSALILDRIGDFVNNTYFREHPDPAKQKEVDAALVKTRDALDLCARLADAGDAVHKDELAQALADFDTAWNELMQIVGPLGVREQHPGQHMKAGPGEIVVQRPLLLSLKVTK